MIHVVRSMPGGGQLLVWRTVESPDVLLGELRLPENLADYHALRSAKRQMEFLGTRVALKRLLGEEFHIFYETSGKPLLHDRCYNISVSHSREWVAVAIHPSISVGVDIECPTDKVLRVYHKFLHKAELDMLSDRVGIQPLQIIWSGKEALYKIIGEEAVDFAAQMRMLPFEVAGAGDVMMEHLPTGMLYRAHYIQNDLYTLVYCLGGGQDKR